MRRLVLLIAAVMAFMSAQPHSAQASFDRELAVAQAVWHPACGQVTVEWGIDVPVTSAWLGAHVPGECIVHLNPGAPELQAYGPRCTIILHEVGHVAGAEHSDNPRSVMRPTFDFYKVRGRWQGVDKRCQTTDTTALTSSRKR